MTEGIRAVEHRRRLGVKSTQHAPAEEEIPDHRLAAGYQLVREYIPGSSLESATPEQPGQFLVSLGTDSEIVLENDRLSVEEEAFVRWRRIVEQLVH
jgi:hypothetical protein